MNSQPMQTLLLVGLPYAAIALFFAGLIRRYQRRFTITALSSQVLESRLLVFGSVPFHLGIVLLILGHLVPLVAPQQWLRFVTRTTTLLTVESIGMAAAFLCLVGLIVLFVRRMISRTVSAGSTPADLAVLAVLIVQVTLGLSVAIMHRWGAVWSAGTTTPYLWSIFTLRPDPTLVGGVPPVMMMHLSGAWIVLALVPFTRLLHMFTFPFAYLGRPPQRVIWARAKVAKPREQNAPDENVRTPPLAAPQQPATHAR